MPQFTALTKVLGTKIGPRALVASANLTVWPPLLGLWTPRIDPRSLPQLARPSHPVSGFRSVRKRGRSKRSLLRASFWIKAFI